MADTKNQTPEAPRETKPENPRKAIREARQRRLQVIDGPSKTIKVYAANDRLREALRHSTGSRFRASLAEGVEWPNDSFTKRRIAEGSVLTEAPAGGEYTAPDETLNPREQAAANKPKKSEAKPPEETKSDSKRHQSHSQPQSPAA